MSRPADFRERGVLVDAGTVRFERLLPGPIDLVWKYLTTRELLTTWLADGDIDPLPGEPIDLEQDVDGLPIRNAGKVHGVVTRAEPPRLLAFTWDFIAGDETREPGSRSLTEAGRTRR